jgi:hypothetical protein
VADSCEHGNEIQGSVKRKEFRDFIGDYFALKDELVNFVSPEYGEKLFTKAKL